MNESPTTGAKRPKIGLALGSGAARGWAHIGAVHELSEMGIKPDIVTGASIGSLVAAALAAGKLDTLEAWVRRLDRAAVIRLLDATLSGGGFIQGRTLLKVIQRHIGNPEIEELPLAFGCVATQLGSGREVWLRKGKLLDAVRASMAMPGVLAPVAQDGAYLLDGGLVNPVPVSLARAMGADIVIAVNLNGDLVGQNLFEHEVDRTKTLAESGSKDNGIEFDDDESAIRRWTEKLKVTIGLKLDSYIAARLGRNGTGPGLFDSLIGSVDIMQDRITRARMAGEPPDIHITPRLRHIGVMDFERAAETIHEGRAATRRERPELRALKRALSQNTVQAAG